MATTKKSTTRKKLAAPVIRKRFISMATLDRLHACKSQQEKFAETFGVDRKERVKITPENIQTARDNGLNLEWLMYKVLPRKWIATFTVRRRNLGRKYIAANGTITFEESQRKIAEVAAKILRKHWGEK